MMKHKILTLTLWLMGLSAGAEEWSAPVIPGADLASLSSSTTVYVYNVDADAFVTYGMNWNTQAICTRLTNGDQTVSVPQQAKVEVSNGQLQFSLNSFANYHVVPLGNTANNIWVDRSETGLFTYAQTASGSHIYTLTSSTYNATLDTYQKYGGQLTLASGQGNTHWAFIPESSITDGSYARYKARLRMYALYQAIVSAGATSDFSSEITTVQAVYIDDAATADEVDAASATLFRAVSGAVGGPLDVSYLFTHADMLGCGSVSDWSSSGASFAWAEFEKYHVAMTLSQTQSVPQGNYDVSIQALYRQDGSDAAPIFSANSASDSIPNMKSLTWGVSNTGNSNGWTTTNSLYIPNNMQSCGQAMSHEGSVKTLSSIAVTDDLTISLAISSSTQWVNWQQVRVIFQGVDTSTLRSTLSGLLTEANSLYDSTKSGASTFKSIINAATTVSNNKNATALQLQRQITTLSQNIAYYKYYWASTSNPLDLTGYIENPSFELGTTGWTMTNMQTQTNTSFTLKQSTTYVEKWVSTPNQVGDCSILQAVSNLPLGVYQLQMVGQNIQQNNSATQSGVSLVANGHSTAITTAADYTLTFTSIESNILLGFLAQGATGNWLACDNFRLLYCGPDLSAINAEMQSYIDLANSNIQNKISAELKAQLESAVTTASALLAASDTASYSDIAVQIRTLNEQAASQIALAELIEKTQHGTGEFATITTDTRTARGATKIFGRFTVGEGPAVLQSGFVYATHHAPELADGYSTRTLSNGGTIHVIEGVQPSTKYYIRPYVITTGYQLSYGDELKVITLPQSTATWSYDDAGSDAENTRIRTAVQYAIDIWHDLTSIPGEHLSVHYNSGVTTADCSYGGWMRVGANSAYQATGTIMHEGAHAVGVGTTGMWYNSDSPLRGSSGTGLWLGDRANAALRFWDNDDTEQMTGDTQHMWPYGVNGANEDDHSDLTYYGNALILQGMHEDGLPPTGNCFASPAYTFDQEDTIRYYLKPESSDYGLNTSFVTLSDGNVVWSEANALTALKNDDYAWTITFNPVTQLYQFQTIGTGQYLSYSGGFGPSTTGTGLQLMRSRTDVTLDSLTTRGYWLISPAGATAHTLTSSASGATTTSDLSLTDASTQQRWIILSEAELFDLQDGSIVRNDVNLDGLVNIEDVRALVNIILGNPLHPHGIIDINADNRVDIADVTALIRIILSK